MAVDTPAKIAVLGAGPIGLEAALYARFLGYEVVVLERGQICENVLAWGHTRMFTPFSSNRSLLGWAAIQSHDEAYQPPADEALLTGREWVERYLLPLSQTDLLADHIRLNSTVLAVGKEEVLKHEMPGDEERGDWPFRVLVREADGSERIELADVVIDATGVFGQANWMGHGGIPAVGEIALRDQIEYGLPDLLGAARPRYEGSHTLLVGNDWITAVNVSAFSELAREAPNTRVTWISRGEPGPDNSGPIQRATDDRFEEGARVVSAANALAHACPEWLQFFSGTIIEAVRSTADGNGFEVELSGGHAGTFSFDRIIANVGFRPDRSLHSELQVRENFATEQALAEATGPASVGAGLLLHPEPNFYVLGAKSFGRGPGFVFSEGLEQVRQLFTIIGDRETLDLYAGAKSLLRS